MIKQDYIVRLIQEILSALTHAILKKERWTPQQWEEYDHLTTRILGCTSEEIIQMNAAMLIDRYKDDKAQFEKTELAALYLITLAEEMKGESTTYRAKLYQEGLILLNYLQEKSDTFSLTRLEIIQLLKREGYQ